MSETNIYRASHTAVHRAIRHWIYPEFFFFFFRFTLISTNTDKASLNDSTSNLAFYNLYNEVLNHRRHSCFLSHCRLRHPHREASNRRRMSLFATILLLLFLSKLSNLTCIHRSSYALAPTQPAPAATASTNSRLATSCPRPSTTTPALLRPTAKTLTVSPESATAAPSAPARRDAPSAPSTLITRTSLTLGLLSGMP